MVSPLSWIYVVNLVCHFCHLSADRTQYTHICNKLILADTVYIGLFSNCKYILGHLWLHLSEILIQSALHLFSHLPIHVPILTSSLSSHWANGLEWLWLIILWHVESDPNYRPCRTRSTCWATKSVQLIHPKEIVRSIVERWNLAHCLCFCSSLWMKQESEQNSVSSSRDCFTVNVIFLTIQPLRRVLHLLSTC